MRVLLISIDFYHKKTKVLSSSSIEPFVRFEKERETLEKGSCKNRLLFKKINKIKKKFNQVNEIIKNKEHFRTC